MKIFKWLSIIIVALILLFVVAAICLVTLVSPNQFKSLIENKMEATLGRKLTIEGNLSWAFFPNFGVKTENIILHNPPDFQQKIFAEVKHLTVGVKLFPLWNKKLESNDITIEGLKLYLIKNSKGATSWNFKKKSDPENLPEHSNHSGDSTFPEYSFRIQALNVKNAEIIWMADDGSQSLNLENLNLKAEDINPHSPFSIKLECDFSSNKKLLGHFIFNSDLSLDPNAEIYFFKKVDSTFTTTQKLELVVKGDMMIDFKHDKIEIQALTINTDTLKTKGFLKVNNLTKNLSIYGNLEVLSFDLKTWLKENGANVANIEISKHAKGELNIHFDKFLNVQGKLNVPEIKIGKLNFNKLILPFHYNGKSLNLSSMTANFYQGEFVNSSFIYFNQTTPEMTFDTRIKNFDTTALMQDLGAGKLKLTGRGNFYFNGKTLIGKDNAVIKNLNGLGNFQMSGGALQGIDIPFLVKSAVAKKKAANDMGQTLFGTVTGEFTITQGVVSNPNLNIVSQDFATKGQGKIDLVNQAIFYHLQTSVNPSLIDLKGLTVPILVSGSLKNPNIGIDVGELAKQFAKQQLKKIAEQHEDETKTGVEIPKNAGKIIKNLFGH